MSDPNHFFHDMIEGVVIWEDSAASPSTPPIDVQAEASSLEAHHHDDAHGDANDSAHDVHVFPVDTGAAATEHGSDAHATDVASADVSHDADTTTA